MKNFFLILGIQLYSSASFANNDILGFWTTIDDETKEAKSIVQIYEYNEKYFVRVVYLLKNKNAKENIKNNSKFKCN